MNGTSIPSTRDPNAGTDNAPSTTVVIPTYNGARRVGQVLDALLLQDARPASFEVIVVDNNSNDGTSDIVEHHESTQNLRDRGTPCRVVQEPQQGLSFARICGITQARGRYVCFLDDDTLPDRGYVRTGTETFDADDAIGLLVSRLRPRYESKVPPSIARREHLFAINRKMGDAVVDFGAVASLAPTLGGGLWVRRSAFLSAVPWNKPELLLRDRVGNKLISGNDIEIGYLIGRAGFRRLYRPDLGLEHCIEERRLNVRYFARLIQGIVRSELTLKERYEHSRYTPWSRLRAAARFGAAAAATPVVLLREDGLRESLFVLASHWAHVQGPYKLDGL